MGKKGSTETGAMVSLGLLRLPGDQCDYWGITGWEQWVHWMGTTGGGVINNQTSKNDLEY